MTAVALSLIVLALASSAHAAGASGTPVATAQSDVPVLAYYYIWFDERSWSRAKTDLPSLGRYSSDDEAVMRRHVEWAKSAGIDGFIVSWKDTPTLTRRLDQLVRIATEQDFKLLIIYQGLDFSRQPVPTTTITRDLSTFTRRYARNPVFDLFGPPVVIWSGTWEYTKDQIAEVTEPYRPVLSILASERQPDRYARLDGIVDGNAYYWSSVDPDTHPAYPEKLQEMARVVHADGGLWFAPAAPGFDARLIGGTRTVERDDGLTLRTEMQVALDSSPDAIGIISWNEFSENTHIEPSCSNGTRYLALIANIEGGHAPADVQPCNTAALAAVIASSRLATPVAVAVSNDGANATDDFDSSSPGGTVVGPHGPLVMIGLGSTVLVCLVRVVQRSLRPALSGVPDKLGG